MMMDTVIRHGRVLASTGFVPADVRIVEGRITEIGDNLGPDGGREIDATGCWVLPGAVDGHVHFNEPGRTEWEGFRTGSAALAAGGTTAFADMPLNSLPPTINRAAFDLKRAAGERESRLDFALWGGLVPGNLDDMEPLADAGVVGFKAFMIDSGIEDFQFADRRTLRDGMRRAAALRLPVAVHAEDAEVIRKSLARASAQFAGPDVWPASRPVTAELEAVRVALDLAGETGCALHIVHAGCPEVVDLVRAARRAGIHATVEVCHHYALLDHGATRVHGVLAKCAPPLRDAANRDTLADRVFSGTVDCIGSDHSPAPPELKAGREFMDAWGGIMGCQHGLLLLADRALREYGETGFATVWQLASIGAATVLGLDHRKGRLAPGFDADLVLLEASKSHVIETGDLRYRHQTSPYVGMELALRVRALGTRGRWTAAAGEDLPHGAAEFLKRKR